jgi:hypothetical protein
MPDTTRGVAIILLTGEDQTALTRKASGELLRLRPALGDSSTMTIAELVPEPPELNSPWKVVMEIRGDTRKFPAAIEGLSERLGTVADRARCALAVGDDHVIFERDIPVGARPVTLYYALFRRPDVSAEKFSHHWKEIHSHLVIPTGYQLTYRQLHSDEHATREASEAAGFDVRDVAGVAHEQFIDQKTFMAATVDPDLAEEVADVANFSDMDRSGGLLTRDVPLASE